MILLVDALSLLSLCFHVFLSLYVLSQGNFSSSRYVVMKSQLEHRN